MGVIPYIAAGFGLILYAGLIVFGLFLIARKVLRWVRGYVFVRMTKAERQPKK